MPEHNTNNTEALELTPKRFKPSVISPSPNNSKIRGLPIELERCPFCFMLLGLPKSMSRAILDWADAAAAAAL